MPDIHVAAAQHITLGTGALRSGHCAAERSTPTRRCHVRRLTQHALQVARDPLASSALLGLPGEVRQRLPHPVLDLDEIFAPRLVAWLELEIARHHPVGSGRHLRQALDGVAHGVDGGGGPNGHGQKNTGSRYAPYTCSSAWRISYRVQ